MATKDSNCDDETYKLSDEITKLFLTAFAYVVGISASSFFINIFSYITVGGQTVALLINMLVSIVLFVTLGAVVVIWLRPFLCKHIDKLAKKKPQV